MPAGSIRRKANGWEVRVSTGRGLDGKYRQVSRYVRGTEADAQRSLNELRLSVAGGQAGDQTTVADLLGTWLSLAKRDLSPTTWERYDDLVRLHLVPALGPILLRKLDPPTLDRHYAALVDQRNLSPTTVRQVHAIVRRALNEAVRWGWLVTNPAKLARTPRLDKREIDPPTTDGVARLLEQARTYDDDLADFLELAAVTGARRGELVGLQWGDVDPERRILTIRRAVIEAHGGIQVKHTKTHASRRVALDDGTLALIAARELRCKQRALALGQRLGPWMFGATAAHHDPIPPDRMTNRFSNLRRACGLEAVRLHDLRHFAATMLIDAGVPIPTVSKRLGHRDTATTLNVYASALESSDRVAADVLSAALRRQA